MQAQKRQRPRGAHETSQAKTMTGDTQELRVGRTKVAVSHLDKVLYPAVGWTKAQLIDYYIRISPVLLPHLKDRPITLKRYPNGVEGDWFYEKRCPAHRPATVKTIPLWSKTHGEDIEYCTLDSLPALVWAANLANLELHTFLSRRENHEQPTQLVFDLDPGPPADIRQCAQIAMLLKQTLDNLKLQCFPKTSGNKGLQISVPLNSSITFEATKTFAHTLAQVMAKANPKLVVSEMGKELREGKVLIDWSQNDRHKTTVCAYSLRAQPEPTVSTPLTWAEVEAARQNPPEAARFLADTVIQRVAQHGDLFAPVLTLKQSLPHA